MQTLVNRAGWVLAAVISLTVLAALAGIARGGPLDPPGPPSSTNPQVEPRTPISSLPFTIGQPGSYFLTKNLTGPGSGDGITVQANDVTIDLNGFTMQGIAGSQNAISEGGGSPARFHWTVKNGTIDGWVRGVYAPDLSDSHVSDLIINGATDVALFAGGAISVERVTAHGNTGNYGLRLGAVAQVTDCFVDGSGALIAVADQSSISHCSTVGGYEGMLIGPATKVDASSVRFATYGIYASAGAVITNNTIGGAGTVSMLLQGNSLVTGNLIDTSSGGGITAVGSANRIANNQFQHMSTAISLSADGNTAYQNAFSDVTTPVQTSFTNALPPLASVSAATNPWSNVTY